MPSRFLVPDLVGGRLDGRRGPLQVGPVRHLDVEDHAGPPPGAVAHLADLAVADRPQRVPLTSRTRVARRVTPSTTPLGSPRSISSPTPYLVLDEDEQAGEEVLDDLLGAEAERHAGDARRRG